MVSKKGELKPPKETWLPQIGGEAATDGRGRASIQNGAVVMKPRLPYRSELVGTLALAAFTAVWIVGVPLFVVQPILDWQTGEASLGLYDVLRIIGYALTTPILIGCLFYCFLALFNPRLTLTLSSGFVPLGGGMLLKWAFTGRSSMIQQLTIMLYGKECASYDVTESVRDSDHSDTKNTMRTETNTFFEMEVFSTQDGREIRFGEVGLVMPSDSMHSFEAYWNKIIWEIGVHGNIKWWPDVKATFKIAVLPAEMEKA